MPGKRKQSAPRKADEQKRQCLTWNMQDMFVNNSDTTDTGEIVAGPSSSHEPLQVSIEHRHTSNQSDGLPESMSQSNGLNADQSPSQNIEHRHTSNQSEGLLEPVSNIIDQSNGLHADQSPSQVFMEHGQTSSQLDGFPESVSNIDQSNGLYTDQSVGSEVVHEAKSVHFDEFSMGEIDIASSPSNVDSFEERIGDANGSVFTDPTIGYDFFLTFYDSVDDTKWHCSLGTIVLNLFSIDGSGKLPKVLPPQASPVLYAFEHTEKHVLHFESLPDLEEEMEGHGNDDSEEQDQDIYVYATTTVGVNILSGLAHMYKKKAARLTLGRYDHLQGTLELQLYLLEEALCVPQFASEGLTGKSVARKLNRTLQELMEWFLGIPIPESYSVMHKKRQDVEGLYRHVREAHQGEARSLTLDPQHALLVPSLRPYQKEAVLWMLEMEQFGADLQQKSRGQAAELHLLWREVEMPDGQTLFFNSYTGSLCKERQSGLVPIPGGILADEMGLGKTVEALALMLLHPRPGFNRTTTAAQDSNRIAIGVLQDENKTTDDILQDKNRTAIGTFQNENKTTDDTLQDKDRTIASCTFQDENKTVADISGTSQDKNRTVPSCTFQGENNRATGIANTLQDENKTTDATGTSGMLKDKNRMAASFTFQDEYRITAGTLQEHNRTACDAVCTLQDKDNASTDIKKPKVECDAQDSVTVTCSKDTDCGKTHVESSEVDLTPGKSHAHPEANRSPIEEKKDVLTCTKVEEEGGSAMDVSNQMSEETAANSSNNAPNFQPDSPEAEAQQPNTSSNEAQQQKRQKKPSNKKTAASKEKSKKSKKGAAVVEPMCIPAPESCNVQSTQRFECICGVTDSHMDSRTRLQCWRCGNWQHAECVNYDLTSDPTNMADPYHCPHCSVSLPAVASGATLIISPAPISHQWVDEINRHVRKAAIKMLVYSGVKKQGFLQPKVLADHDIVITTYDVLRLELNYVDIPHSNSSEGRRFRHQKRYMAVPSPLPSVEWWRVCLDEAQMVECTTAKAAEMALRLSAVNRWCVTGTPIQRNLEDLYGLLLFLGVDPYWVKHWWERLLYQPYCHGNPQPMYEVISKVMWRTAKKDVLDQINLPGQTEEVHWLKFSPVEEHFYRRKHEDCSRHAFKVLSQWHDLDTKLCQLDRRTMQTMLWPLLKLRQACCHPQAVRGEFLPLHKSTMTMDELLKSLTQKCKIECEEAHRQLICALNGLAGIHIIKEEYPEAVEKYREVLRSVQEHEGRLKTDKLQRLHTLHNLARVLQRKLPGVAPTLRDDQLLKEADELKTYYMQKSLDKIHASQQTLLPIQQKVTQLRRKLQPGTPWWMDALQWAIYWGKDEDLAERIRNELSGDRDPDATSIVNKFRDLRGLQFLLTSQLENLQQSHAAVCTAVNHLSQDPTQQIIQSAVECHLRPEKGEELHTCDFCKADDLFLEYESRLFSFTAKRLEDMVAEEEENPERQVTRRGVWAQSETEKCLKIVLSFCKSSRLEEQWVEEGGMQVELFEQLRREYKQLHVVWMALRDRVASIDELDMATTRLRLRLPEEERTDPLQPNIIEPGEIDHQWIKNLNDKAVATSLLHRKLGQLLYLRNLAKSQEYQKDGVNPEPCPICQRQLGAEWSVLMCGHCFCEECISVLVNQFGLGGRRGSIRCAICRQLTATRDISYVSTEAKEQEDVDVKGSHSTKVEAVVRTLKLIQQNDPTAKSLVFSTWQDVLDVVATALRENNMEYRAINGIHRFQENLTDFKYDGRIGVLLLPLHTGSHGLNIIEATHVLLVEPIINPAQEAQAIGRVHRIGQTKATIVHRFLVQNTIEERIHAMKKHISASDSIDTQSEGTVLTVGDLRDLFSDAFHHREDDSPPPPQQEYDQANGALEEFDDGDGHHGDGHHGDHHHGDGGATP
ncbi:PREDICTED: E3 ubiquitin-protein ligase SHPRH-like [Branchiostoma belcheri]|uniref:E3 ubiquitin-protein ligase SHPRH-like n=1 Tax=Branchiostoma belcheri TaxID=7741 RepID=A0A6P4ZET8_BRABE|nr:PREDICTED: E3 ubiquitin-protein ligase SHPRH-like [Branchiostoma belcheri]